MKYRRVVRGLSAALMLTGLFAPGAYAADTPGDGRSRLLQRMDRTGDGKISFEEYRNATLWPSMEQER